MIKNKALRGRPRTPNELTPYDLKRLVKSTGMSQKEAAEFVGTYPARFSHWCRGRLACPAEIGQQLRLLNKHQTTLAARLVDELGRKHAADEKLVLIRPVTSLAAKQQYDLPTVSTWKMVLFRIYQQTPPALMDKVFFKDVVRDYSGLL